MGQRQELPVARIHARGAGHRLANAGRDACERVARTGRAVGYGTLIVARVCAAVAIPATFVALLGVGVGRSTPRAPEIKLNIPAVRFDDAKIKAMIDLSLVRARTSWTVDVSRFVPSLQPRPILPPRYTPPQHRLTEQAAPAPAMDAGRHFQP